MKKEDTAEWWVILGRILIIILGFVTITIIGNFLADLMVRIVTQIR